MAVPCSFDESDEVLDKPPDMSVDECSPLSILRVSNGSDVPTVISCFKLTAEELIEVNRTGRVWLGVYGFTMPPAYISGVKPFRLTGEAEG